METFECIEKRRSIRKYLDRPVEWEKVGDILRAGQQAPSSGNLQDWKFIVVTDLEKRRKIAEAALKQYWIEEAPVIIVVCGEPEKAKRFYSERGEDMYMIQNNAAAIENMLLAATDSDLGSCWVSAFDDDMLRGALGIPDNVKPQAVLTFGYANEQPLRPAKYRLEDLTFLNRWGNKIANVDLALNDWSEVVRKKMIEAKEAAEKAAKGKGPVVARKIKQHVKKAHARIKKALNKQKQ